MRYLIWNLSDRSVLDGPWFLIQKENFVSIFTIYCGRFQWSIVSEVSNPASSPVRPLVKSTLGTSDCFHRTFCHSGPVQPLCFKYSQCTIESIKFFLCDSDNLHFLSWCIYSIKLDDKMRGLRHQVCPEIWCLSEKPCGFTSWWKYPTTFELLHAKFITSFNMKAY